MNNQNELTSPDGKKFVNELMNPEQALKEAVKNNNLQRAKKDIVEKNNSPLLTNDGRVVLNEDKAQENI